MMVVVLVAGIGLLLGGLATVVFGIQLDLSFGNTLISSGAIVACTGMIMLGLWVAVRELKTIARQLVSGLPAESRAKGRSSSAGLTANLGDKAPEDGGFLFGGDQPGTEHAGHGEAGPASWREQAASRDRGAAPAAPVEAAPPAKQRRNLLFSSTSRKERERAAEAATEPSAPDPRLHTPAVASPAAAEPAEAPPATFDDAWPKSERARTADAPLPRRGGRAPSTFTEAAAVTADRYLPAPRNEEPPAVTVLKSGVVDGMAYSLYSDGSIEAQMPEGMMRFASIDELRSHLDQRP
jgi:hypothetical protein